MTKAISVPPPSEPFSQQTVRAAVLGGLNGVQREPPRWSVLDPRATATVSPRQQRGDV